MNKLVYILILLGCIPAFGAITPGGGVTDRTVIVRAGSLTNVVLQSNSRYLLDVGTNTISTYAYDTDPLVSSPHWFIRDKTKVTFEGLGWQSAISTTHTGTLAAVYNCQDIKFKNLAFYGTRVPNGGTLLNGLISGIILQGTNVGTVFEDCLFQNHTIHGVAGLFSNSRRTSFVRCTFRGVGHTNYHNGTSFTSDGACIMSPGSELTVIDCRFEDSFNGVEAWGTTGSASSTGNALRDWKVHGNSFSNMWGFSVYHQSAAGGIENNSEGFIYTGNTISYNPTTLWGIHAAMMFRFGKRGIVANNTIMNAFTGIRFQNQGSGAVLEAWKADNNHLFGINGLVANGHGMAFLLDGQLGLTRNVDLTRNTVEFCAGEFVHAYDAINCKIDDNFVRAVNTNGSGNGSIWLRELCRSNSVAGNTFKNFGETVANRSAYAVRLNSTADYNIVKDNDIKEFATSAWTDGGAGNEIRDNWVGTNRFGITPLTNGYAATNVVINLASRETQVLDATNSMLLIWTNAGGSAAISGKRTRVSLINNKATNMNVAHTAANLRLFGQHAGTVTNGRTLTFEVEVLGTNYNITAFQQQN